MPGPIIVTTSWDDGHPKDLRIAEELQGRALSGSFFVPLTGLGGKPTLTPGDLRCLRHQGFEIGAHTVSHKSLAGLKGRLLRFEVSYCKQKLEQILGADVTMFCYPNGRYDRNVVRHVREAGFRGARTTRMLSLEHKFSPFEMPTSLQAFPHPLISYLKNLGKNGDTPGLFRYLLEYRGCRSWVHLGKRLFDQVLQRGGIWHLYGHSWEIDELGLWSDLREMLDYVSRREGVTYASNGEVLGMLQAGKQLHASPDPV